MNRKQCPYSYEDIISVENLLAAWQEFVRGKRNKRDVQEFQSRLMDNILALHRELRDGTYRHGSYHHFKISDPKLRDIHKASVRDRLVHHAIHRILYPFFDHTFIADSYSCRVGKGTHRALNQFRAYTYQVSKNHTRTCWVLKCDIRKFFASIDQQILLDILLRHIPDARIQVLLVEVVSSFYSTGPGKGLPLGNLTSQLMVNIYMNEFDQFMKHRLRVWHYIRYADDFVFLSPDKAWLVSLIPQISLFLGTHLRLRLHPNKVSIRTIASGIDFLGWVHFPHHRVLRTSTKRRALRNCRDREADDPVLRAYAGLCGWGNGWKVRRLIGLVTTTMHPPLCYHRRMEKEFDRWNEDKKSADALDISNVYFDEREVWWVRLGVNIGFEQDGTGDVFERPVVIIKKFNPHVFLGVPLSTTTKKGKYYFALGGVENREATAILSQIRLLDARRLINRAGVVETELFARLVHALIKANFDGVGTKSSPPHKRG